MTATPRPSSRPSANAHRAMTPAYFRGYPAAFWYQVMNKRRAA